jgi:sugar O-acyltransferase (sialic acid O-acetyltransferase NeuD family)
MTTPLLLVGAGGLGREAAEAVRAINARQATFELLGFLDDDPALDDAVVGGVPIVGRADDLERFPGASITLCTAGLHDPMSRHRLAGRLAVPACRYATIVHPSAVMPPQSEIGPGCVVLATAVSTTPASLGAHVVLMPGVVLTHDNQVGDFATICSGVRLGGQVHVGEGAYIGAGALVREDTSLGSRSVVGMGAIVLDDVPDGETFAGAPARRIDARG